MPALHVALKAVADAAAALLVTEAAITAATPPPPLPARCDGLTAAGTKPACAGLRHGGISGVRSPPHLTVVTSALVAQLAV